MPNFYDTHPDDLNPTCPAWAEWLDDRHVSVKCRTCTCVYTVRYWGTGFKGNKSYTGWVGGIPKTCGPCRREKAETKRKAKPMDPALVVAVREHARANYNRDGWDIIEEAYTDEELWEVIAGSKDAEAAIRNAGEVARLHAERREDVRRAASW